MTVTGEIRQFILNEHNEMRSMVARNEIAPEYFKNEAAKMATLVIDSVENPHNIF